jgi:hypothetical protein
MSCRNLGSVFGNGVYTFWTILNRHPSKRGGEILRFIFENIPSVFVDFVRGEKRAFSEECTIGSGGYCVRLKRTEQGYLRHLETGFLFKTYKPKKEISNVEASTLKNFGLV